MYKVKSFNIDHTKIIAPSVTLIDTLTADNLTINKYAIRLCKPNEWYIRPETMHTLEHFFALEIRNILKDVFDLSPMGCMTGFYLTVLCDYKITDIETAITECMSKVITANDIPAANILECGNYKFMDLADAKIICKSFLNKNSINIFL